ncbi:recombination mediator RecR [Mycoplasmoides alvi]|uniref:recombination mediator RecR n=1 Tax=Mycoplasmoides alvi TaxID=78580 RepID=UPI00051AF435|nr:recombination mediator RecR [Mycoplasmoides alvi]
MSDLLEFEHLVDAIKALPSIGSKNARKIAFFLLKKDEYFIREFVQRIQIARANIKKCLECNNLSKNKICDICNSPNRDKKQICVVSTVDDLLVIENCQGYNGLYHVLGGELSKSRNITPEMFNFDFLVNRIQKNEIKEILIATNFTIDGELTANYLKLLLKNLPINIFRISMGLPINSSIDYADEHTLKIAIENKNKIK